MAVTRNNSYHSSSFVFRFLVLCALIYEEVCHQHDFNGDVKAKQGHLMTASSLSLVFSTFHAISAGMNKDVIGVTAATAEIGASIAKVIIANDAHQLAQQGGSKEEIEKKNDDHKIAHYCHTGVFALHATKDIIGLATRDDGKQHTIKMDIL